ncbi:MAG: DUF805 domain-containing protein [Gammaproteobacteria bacterium]|nr:DUF805 domain-containing protein [Gammaproteobacteria bacterium]
MNWYIKVLKDYAVFSGRAQRAEYWMFLLFNSIIGLVLGFIEGVIAGTGIISGLYALAILIPSLAVLVRRLHDTGRSGWWFLIVFLPIIGYIVLLVFLVLDSQPEENRYGPNPRG